MDSEAFQSSGDLLDLNFQSLAMKHMDLKQMELDTAAAKVDELTKQLESLWSDSPTPPGSQAGAPARRSRYSSSPVQEPFGSRGSSRKAPGDGADTPFGRSESAPALLPYSSLSPKGRPSSPRTSIYLQPDAYSSLDRAPSPSPRVYEGAGGSLGRAPSPRPGSGPFRQQGTPTPFDLLARASSHRVSSLAEGPQVFFPERGPSHVSPRLRHTSRIRVACWARQQRLYRLGWSSPLSMIFKLQNAFWEHGASRAMFPGSPIFSRAPPPKLPPQPQAPPQPQLLPQPQPQSQVPPQPQSQPPSQPQLQLQPPAPVPQFPQQTWSEGESAMGSPEGLVKGGPMAGDPTSRGSHHGPTSQHLFSEPVPAESKAR
ncbi:LOW QUALITY PROTEIN: relA-associated inhibitor [Myotis lucifugus]|uniref:LOW QUALITY PROTEIN: relA-associated inhibitor n=1 Tax=Myotis lucifugus TaxID=59463 RepID=UPI000CCC66F0|nr:LOW QUALITY PROTEIN: relA-associated inhibitor [Myotis lucifugus]